MLWPEPATSEILLTDTSYSLAEIIDSEQGWLFYTAAFKTWRVIHSLVAGNSLLDIGCGSGIGLGLHQLFDPKLAVVGLEGNDDGRPVWDARGLNVVTGDIYELPFEADEFDTVVSSHVLEHLEFLERALLESMRVAKRRVIHAVPSGNVDDKNHGTPHLHIFSRVSIIELAKKVGAESFSLHLAEDTHMSSLILAIDIKQ